MSERWTQEERIAAHEKVHRAVMDIFVNNYYASPDAIIAAYSENACVLQCELTAAKQEIAEARELLEKYVSASEGFGFGISNRVHEFIERNALPDTGAETKENRNESLRQIHRQD